jgi:hypothetical protein
MPVLSDGTPVDQTGKTKPVRKLRLAMYGIALLAIAWAIGAPAYAGN